MKSNKQINNKSKKFRKMNGGSLNTKFVNACKLGSVEDAMNYIENPKININFKDNEGNTALQYACLWGNLELVDALVKRGADIKSRGKFNNTPLHNTCIYNNYNNVFIVKILLDNGADIDAKKMDGRTPLDDACYNGHMDLALVLMDSGADIHWINDYNQTLLHRASFNGPVDLVKILIDKGIDIHFKDAQNMTALHIACGKGNMEIAIALIDMGADISAKDKAGRTPLQIAPPIIDKRKLIEHSLRYRERMQNIEAERELEEKRKQDIHNLYKSEKRIDPITGNRGIEKCGMCRSLYYESKDTQRQHWKSGHREQCRELCQMKKNDINQKGGKRKTKKNKNSKRKTRKH